jgi:hypothetical protein
VAQVSNLRTKKGQMIITDFRSSLLFRAQRGINPA